MENVKKMKIIYLSSMCSEEKYKQLFEEAKNMPGQAVMKYHRLLSQGFSMCENVEVICLSALPITRLTYNGFYIRKSYESDQKVRIVYFSVFNIPIIKHLIVLYEAIYNILKYNMKEKTMLVCDGLHMTIVVATLVASIAFRIPSSVIVTDVPGNTSRRLSNNVFRFLIQKFDSYIFLTAQMNSLLNKKSKPYVVEEGSVDYRMEQVNSAIKDKYCKRVFMYTGAIKKIYGVKQLVESFLDCTFDDVELHIYGDGDYKAELIEICKKNKQIRYFGVKLIDVVIKAQQKADLLINPRFTDEEYTKYSFPSKNMEYMVSGTAVLTTNLPGMPDEYKKYVYLFEGESKDGFKETLLKISKLSREELRNKGELGKKFVLEQKNNVLQAKKIAHMFETML